MARSPIPVKILSGYDPSPDTDSHLQATVFLWVALTLDFMTQQKAKEESLPSLVLEIKPIDQ